MLLRAPTYSVVSQPRVLTLAAGAVAGAAPREFPTMQQPSLLASGNNTLSSREAKYSTTS
jgi:hypothetical protein